jgi:hemerythrin-like domain-containing protein
MLMQAAAAGPLVLLGATGPATAKGKPKAKAEKDVSPTEDLMREHGVLRRLLLVYGETVRRLDGGQEVKVELLAQSAEIIRAFIEDYHEKDEEELIFPKFRKAGKLVDLVDVLVQQHQAGRKLTADVLRLATAATLKTPTSRQELSRAMRTFMQMYEPHSAREDTVLFPAFRQLVTEKELTKLQDLFEDKEKALPMGDFEKMVAEVGKIEQNLGIYDLAKFTPKAG